MPRMLLLVLWGQGIYYAMTGIWPLISMQTFEAVTGPKTDDWLVQTVGILVLCTGGILIYSAVRRSFPLQVALLAIGNALGLAIVDIVFSLNGTISMIYLADAAAEIILIALYLYFVPRLR